MGATTIKRKTVLMNDLINLEFGKSKDAKHATMQLIRKIYETTFLGKLRFIKAGGLAVLAARTHLDGGPASPLGA